jgi:hypothetical protein
MTRLVVIGASAGGIETLRALFRDLPAEGGRIRFRCHIGHAYTIDSLLADITEGIEQSMGRFVRLRRVDC